jgi:hypothetical protein
MVVQQLLRQSTAAAHALKPLSRTAFACEAVAQPAFATFTPGWQATSLREVTMRRTLRYPPRGRPGQAPVPAERGDHIEGAPTASLAVRDALVAQHSCVLPATNALDAGALSPQALPAGDQGQTHVERGVRFLKAPLCLASSPYLKNRSGSWLS